MVFQATVYYTCVWFVCLLLGKQFSFKSLSAVLVGYILGSAL